MGKSCLDYFASIFAILIGILGVIIIVLSITYVFKDDFLADNAKNYKHASVYIFLAIGIFFIVVCILGLIGSCTNCNSILCIYSFLIILLFMIMLAFAIACAAVGMKYNEDIKTFDEEKCRGVDWLKDIDNYVLLGGTMFCRIGCPCNVTISNFKNSNNSLQALSFIKDPSGPIKIQTCPAFESQLSKYKDYTVIMEGIEELFNCSGICTPFFYHIFADVNLGDSGTEACGAKLMQILRDYLTMILVTSFIFAAILWVNSYISIGLWCKKRGESVGKEENNKEANA